MSTLNVFAKEINALAGNIKQNELKLKKLVADEVVQFVATATPVLTGQASGNWKTSLGAPDTSVTLGPSGPGASITAAKTALMSLRDGQDIHISNNLPYITLLNQGSSAKAPAMFVEASVIVALNVIGRFNLLVK